MRLNRVAPVLVEVDHDGRGLHRHQPAVAGTPVLILTDDTTVTVTRQTTGEVLATHTVDPARTYWRDNDRSPGRWPGLLPDMNDDAEHLCTMSRVITLVDLGVCWFTTSFTSESGHRSHRR
ncbi:hypothetical protein [Agrococcus sediminis]|uniref:hypothetical protein n=1 Tax=Agrococcus sediminis TaxID=2599924 RepID=UPI0034129ECD